MIKNYNKLLIKNNKFTKSKIQILNKRNLKKI